MLFCWLGLLGGVMAVGEPPAGVAAMVDNTPIYVEDVEREVAIAIGDRKVDEKAKSVLRDKALEQLVDQQLILTYLSGRRLAASEADVDLAVDRMKKQVALRELDWGEYLKQRGHNEASFQRMLKWKLTWRRYLDRYLTEENLQKYFEGRKRRFDGTQLEVAHILFKPTTKRVSSEGSKTNGQSNPYADALEQARQVRSQIEGGELTFADAARRYSEAPTGKDGGDLGWISRHAPMPEAFSEAAFALEKGEVSPPVVSPFGVHLIYCKDVKPGQKTWRRVRDELEKAVTAYLFNWVADRQRPQSKITITGTTSQNQSH